MTTKTTAKSATTPAKEDVPAAALDLTADLQALARPRSFGGANARPIPPEIERFVEDAHAAWKQNPYAWRAVTLSSPDAVAEVLQLAKIYAGRRSTAVTVQRRKSDNPCELVYRVRDKIRQNRQSIVGMTEVPSSPAPSTTEA